ncbi:hypothetical protein [Roseicyclus sp.]
MMLSPCIPVIAPINPGITPRVKAIRSAKRALHAIAAGIAH